ncbi:MAG: zf-HC2 domain-containing protein [Planctomycetota bacterium]
MNHVNHRLDSRPAPGCAAVQPLLFAAIEGQVTPAERLEVHAHLATCDRCRSWERGERALTALLKDPPAEPPQPTAVRGRTVRIYSLLGAVLAASLLLFLLPSATPRGSVLERRLGPDHDWQAAEERAFEGAHVVDAPATVAVTVKLGDDVQLETVGPARLTLEAVGNDWSVDVVTGSCVATIAPGAQLHTGDQVALGAGQWLLSPGTVTRQGAAPPPDREDTRSTTDVLAAGVAQFGQARGVMFGGSAATERQHLIAAEALLAEALARADTTTDQQRQALFYYAASISRQARDDEASALYERYLSTYPDGDEAALVRHYQACHLLRTGRRDEAKALFERVVAERGGSPLGDAAAAYLRMMASDSGAPNRADRGTVAPRSRKLSAERAPMAPHPGRGDYLVVPVALRAGRTADRGFLAAAAAAKQFHGAAEWPWDGADFTSLGDELRRRQPANVLFVLRPDHLDLALHRRLLLLSAAIDDDWFCDFAFGYLTAENGAMCEQLWQRIQQRHEGGTMSGTWWQASVSPLAKSLRYAEAPPAVAGSAGFNGPHYYYGTKDPELDAVIDESLATMADAAVVAFTGCGDPQGIWLFDDQRNLDRDKHWAYDPARVGDDPQGQMPRLMAARFRALHLNAPVLWSGTCHSGAVHRVFVEGDIVSTFGIVDGTTVHTLEPENSLALSWLAAGAASMLVPLGANHGMSVAMEVDFALRHGASLGETIKSTYDDVLLAAEGDLVLDVPQAGGPKVHREAVMQGGGANRILIGDPALRPFAATASAAEAVRVDRDGDDLTITIVRQKGWQPRSWDMFGTARSHDYRVLTRVDLTAVGRPDMAALEATVTAASPDGNALGYAMQRAALEDHNGRRYLHLQANGTRAELERKAATISFHVHMVE